MWIKCRWAIIQSGIALLWWPMSVALEGQQLLLNATAVIGACILGYAGSRWIQDLCWGTESDQSKTHAIRLEGGGDVYLGNNKFIGFDEPIYAKNVQGLKAERNVAYRNAPPKEGEE